MTPDAQVRPHARLLHCRCIGSRIIIMVSCHEDLMEETRPTFACTQHRFARSPLAQRYPSAILHLKIGRHLCFGCSAASFGRHLPVWKGPKTFGTTRFFRCLLLSVPPVPTGEETKTVYGGSVNTYGTGLWFYLEIVVRGRAAWSDGVGA